MNYEKTLALAREFAAKFDHVVYIHYFAKSRDYGWRGYTPIESDFEYEGDAVTFTEVLPSGWDQSYSYSMRKAHQ